MRALHERDARGDPALFIDLSLQRVAPLISTTHALRQPIPVPVIHDDHTVGPLSIGLSLL